MHNLPQYQYPTPEYPTLIVINETTLAYQCHPKFLVYVRVHSWYCEKYINDMYPPL